MLYRLVRPMSRQGSQFKQYVRRIPSDLRDRVGGLRLVIPVGDHLAEVRLSRGSQAVRVSLRTSNPIEVKARNAAADTYLDEVFANLRTDKPVPLSHMQATALAGEVYRAWAKPEGRRERVLAVELTQDRSKFVPVDPSDDPELWDASATHIADLMASVDQSEATGPLEKAFGPIVDRLLIAKGINRTDAKSRETILIAVGRSLQDAFRSRQRNAEGDYAPDVKASRFPA